MIEIRQYESIWNNYEKLQEELYKVAAKRNSLQKDLAVSYEDFQTLKIKIKDLEMEFNSYDELGKRLTARIVELEEGGKND